MKYFLASILIAVANSSFAQISLEHTYTKSNYLTIVNIEGDGNKYLSVDSLTKNVILYNEDHSLWKRINTTTPIKADFLSVSCVSKRFIDTDDDIELAYTFSTEGTTTEPPKFITRIYKEDGSIILSLSDVWQCTPAKMNGAWKIIAYKTIGSETDVYSTPGIYLNITKPNTGSSTENIESLLYPNPMGEASMLKYTLPAGTREATMTIYNMSGAAVRTLKVTDAFSEILINRGELPSGLYTYKIFSSTNELSNEMFVIK